MILLFTKARLASLLAFTYVAFTAMAVTPKLAIQSGHEGSLDLITATRDGKIAATASFDGKITLWDVSTQQKLYNVTPISAKRPVLTGLHFVGSNDNSLALITTTGIHVMDTSNPESVKSIPQRGLSGSTLSVDRSRIYYAATQFGKVVIESFDTQTGKVTEHISHKPDASQVKVSRKSTISKFSVSADGSEARIIMAPEGSILLYDLRSNWPMSLDESRADFQEQTNDTTALGASIISSAALPEAGQFLVIAEPAPSKRIVSEYYSGNNSLKPWQTDRFKASSLRSMRDGSGFLVLSEDGFYSVRLTSGELRVHYHLIKGFKDVISLSNPNQVAYLTYVNDQTKLCFTNIGAQSPSREVPVEVGYVLDFHTVQMQLVLSPDGTRLAVVSASHANVFDSTSGEQLQQRIFQEYLLAENTTMQSAAFAGDNQTLYITTKAGLIDLNFELDFARVIDPKKFTHLHSCILTRGQESKENKMRGIDAKSSQAYGHILQDFGVTPLINAPPRPLVVDWSNKGDYVAIRGRQAIHVFDFSDKDKEIAQLPTKNKTAVDIVLFKEGALCAAINTDGSLSIWDVKSSDPLGTLVLTAQTNDWIFATEEGYFDSSPKGLSKASFIIGKTLVPTTAFFEVFHLPRLASRMIEGYRPPAPESAMSEFRTPPSIRKIEVSNSKGNPLDSSIEIESESLAIRVFAESTAATVQEIRLYQNGKLISNKTRGLFVEDDESTTALSERFNVRLIPGVNEFKAIAYNAARLESTAESLSLTYKPNFDDITGINLHLVLVGINEYKNPKYNLNYAVADATAVSELLQANSNSIYSKTYVHTLADKEATKDGILELIDKVKSTSGPRDTFVFYYAGHGVVSEDSTFYLVPTEVTQLYGADDGLKQKGIASELLFAASRDIPAQKQLFILDACQSAGALAGIGQRGAAEEKAIAQLARSTGTHWLTASGSEQFATEFADLGHGAFTYTLLKALNGEADTGDGKVTVNELKAYLESEVPEITAKHKGTAQYPASYGYGQDFPISLP